MASGSKRPGTAVRLGPEDEFEQVQEWLGNFLKPSEMKTVLKNLENSGEQPDAEVLFVIAKQPFNEAVEQLRTGLGILPYTVRVKILKHLTLAEAGQTAVAPFVDLASPPINRTPQQQDQQRTQAWEHPTSQGATSMDEQEEANENLPPADGTEAGHPKGMAEVAQPGSGAARNDALQPVDANTAAVARPARRAAAQDLVAAGPAEKAATQTYGATDADDQAGTQAAAEQPAAPAAAIQRRTRAAACKAAIPATAAATAAAAAAAHAAAAAAANAADAEAADDMDVDTEADEDYEVPEAFLRDPPEPPLNLEFKYDECLKGINFILAEMVEVKPVKEGKKLLKKVAMTLFPASYTDITMYNRCHKNKYTDEVSYTPSEATPAMLLNKLGDRIRCSARMDEQSLRPVVAALVRENDLKPVVEKYMDDSFAVVPPYGNDQELVDALMLLWSRPKPIPVPARIILGYKTLYLTNYHIRSKKHVLLNGTIDNLLAYFTLHDPPTLRLDKSKYNKRNLEYPQMESEMLEWLKNICSLVAGQIKARYTLEGQKVVITFEGRRQDIVNRPDEPDACDLLLLLKGLDHMQHERGIVERMEKLRQEFEAVVKELTDAEVDEVGGGPDGEVTLGQVEDLMQMCEGNTREETQGLSEQLRQKLKLPLRPYQKQALAKMIKEERSSGNGRWLWVELPTVDQPRFVPLPPVKRDSDDEADDYSEDDAEDNGVDIEDLDEDEDGSDQDSSTLNKAQCAMARAERFAARQRAAEAVAIPPMDAYARLLYSPVLNALVWSSDIKALQQGVGRLSLSTVRGGFCCLEVGMGKTALVLALTQLPSAAEWEAPPPDEWNDHLLYDGITGYPQILPKAGTLVIVPNTLAGQWDKIEIPKFIPKENVCGKVLQSKRKVRLPRHLLECNIAIMTPQVAQKNVGVLQSVIWERIVVDEAHQEQTTLTLVKSIPARSRWCLTGTPVSKEAADLAKMLEMLHLPAFSLVSRSPHKLGYILNQFMIRYTKDGKISGMTNLELPPLTERTHWLSLSAEDRTKYDLLAEEQRKKLEMYVEDVRRNQELRDNYERLRRKHHIKPSDCVVQGLRVVQWLKPLREACAGGIEVELPHQEPEYHVEYEDEHKEEDNRNMWRFESKIEDALIPLLKWQHEEDPTSKALIFSSFPAALDYIKAVLVEEGFGTRTITGSMSLAQKGKALEDFLYDPPTTIFLLNANVATVGLTLTAANYIYLIEPSMNPSQPQQAIGRCHRMGQTKPVTVTHLVVRDSVEQRITEMMERRKVAGQLKEISAPANQKAKLPRGHGRKVGGDDTIEVANHAEPSELEALFY